MDTCKDQTSQGYCEYIIEVLDVLNKHKALDRDVTNKILSPAERVDSLGRHRDFLLQRLDSLRTEVERLTRERDEAIRQIGPLAAENERLRGALEALGVMPDGYCFCSTGRDPDKAHHEPECRDARAALAGEGSGQGILDDSTAEVERLRGLLHGIPADIIDLCDGQFGEEALLVVKDIVETLEKVAPGHPCRRCKGAGWWWSDEPKEGCTDWLEKCDHTPTPEKAREA